MSLAVGIHRHPERKLGRRPPKRSPALLAASFLTGTAQPIAPQIIDHFKNTTFGLYENDLFGVCGPTALANLMRLLSKGLTGTEIDPSQEDVFDLYRRSGNPNFDPNTGQDDRGVDLQTMLEAAVTGGIGGIRPICFARVNPASDAELDLAEAVFGGLLFGGVLQRSQMTQTEANPPVWDYHAPHAPWGGHAFMGGKYTGQVDDVISWAVDIELTPAFRRHQLEEAWLVVFDWHLQDPAFLAGVNIVALERCYRQLTGKNLPVPKKTPAPKPMPAATKTAKTSDSGD